MYSINFTKTPCLNRKEIKRYNCTMPRTYTRSTPYHISVYDKRDDFDFRIVNFPHMDSNIPANPAYGIYISQLVRYARICTSKADFLHRLRQVSSRLHRQGFKSAFLLRSLTKFFNRHGAIIGKFDTTLRELRTAVHE